MSISRIFQILFLIGLYAKIEQVVENRKRNSPEYLREMAEHEKRMAELQKQDEECEARYQKQLAEDKAWEEIDTFGTHWLK